MLADFLCQLIYWVEWCFIAYKLQLGFIILMFHLVGERHNTKYRYRIMHSFILWFMYCFYVQGWAVG